MVAVDVVVAVAVDEDPLAGPPVSADAPAAAAVVMDCAEYHHPGPDIAPDIVPVPRREGRVRQPSRVRRGKADSRDLRWGDIAEEWEE